MRRAIVDSGGGGIARRRGTAEQPPVTVCNSTIRQRFLEGRRAKSGVRRNLSPSRRNRRTMFARQGRFCQNAMIQPKVLP
jgi:hypothetical protein